MAAMQHILGNSKSLLRQCCNRKVFKQLFQPFRLCSSLFIADERETTDFYTEEHLQLKNTLRKIIEKDINPHVDEWEKAKHFPAHQVFKKLGDAGFLGVTRPTEYGGLGLDFSYSVAVAEELGNITCGALPMAIGVQTDMATPALARFGSDELKRNFLAPTIAGDMVVSIAVSEPHAGSDVANIKTRAVRDGDYLVINGSKMWITNASHADYIVLLANTNDGPAHKSKSLIVLPMNLPGIKVDLIDKLGMHASDTNMIFLEDVRVPASHIIGQEGLGFVYQMMQFQEERLFAVASAITPLRKVIRDTAEYCKQRKAFGKSLLENQVIQYRLAELETEVELLRSLLYRATKQYVGGQDVTKLASMGKLKVGRLAREIPDACLQYWGGMGFTSEVLISRLFRDFRLLSIGGGADEVMLAIIAKEMKNLPPFK
ncbi:probable acyl-CoA dehydrogenase 6 [Watersipora subatra]|uniref:probable acyl-CoA dehydrogenase 6 n=1 Tax=Watersipora subatra TaxID=2589382 RepID=UPI00355B3C66